MTHIPINVITEGPSSLREEIELNAFIGTIHKYNEIISNSSFSANMKYELSKADCMLCDMVKK